MGRDREGQRYTGRMDESRAKENKFFNKENLLFLAKHSGMITESKFINFNSCLLIHLYTRDNKMYFPCTF